MLRFLPAFVLLTALTPLARADSFDDLTITGNGLVLTFTLPTTSSAVEYYRQDSIGFDGGHSGAMNGVSGLPVGVTFNFSVELFYGDLRVSIGGASYAFDGESPISITIVPLSYEDYDLFIANLIPNTYDLFTFDLSTYTRTDYTLTITPVAASSTPEPATLALLATGTLGLFSTLRRRLLR